METLLQSLVSDHQNKSQQRSLKGRPLSLTLYFKMKSLQFEAISVVCFTLFTSCVLQDVNKSDSQGLKDSFFELPYFSIKTDNFSLHPGLKYSTFHRCIIPEKLTKGLDRNQSAIKRTWRVYWSKIGWDSYYFENGDELDIQEEEKETPLKVQHSLSNPTVGIGIGWIVGVSFLCLLLYPLLAMLFFRIFLWVWDKLSARWMIIIIRKIVIKLARRSRNNVLKIYKDAGKRPPISRYSLPQPLRLEPYEPTPKELDESDMEFWSSDDEEFTIIGKTDGKVKVLKPMPEFTSKYPEFKPIDTLMSKNIFAYFKKVRQYGMLAVWTDGVTDINLEEISKTHGGKQPLSNRSSKPSTSTMSTRPSFVKSNTKVQEV